MLLLCLLNMTGIGDVLVCPDLGSSLPEKGPWRGLALMSQWSASKQAQEMHHDGRPTTPPPRGNDAD